MPTTPNNFIEAHLLRTLGDHTLDLIYAKDTQGRFIFANSALARMSGAQSAEKMLGKTDFDFHSGEMAQNYYNDDQKVIASGEPLVDREELVPDSETGQSRWHSTTKVPLRDRDGIVIGIVGITRDITLSKQAEIRSQQLNKELEQRVAERTEQLETLAATLEKERHMMRTLIDAMPDNIFAKDTESKFLLANRAIVQSMATTTEEILGSNDFDYFPEAMARQYFNDEQEILRTGKPMLDREEPSVDNNTGRTRWLLTSKVPVRDDAGRIVSLVGIGRDITKRREAELALRQSEERFRSLSDLSSDWYWEQDHRLRFIEMTNANGKSGYLSSEIIGKTLRELPNTELLSGDWDEYLTLAAQRKPFRDLEFRHTTASGGNRCLSVSGLPIFSDSGEFMGYRGVGQDISERKLAEERIRYLATHDSLTALPNRMMFSEILTHSICSAKRYGRKLAVLFIDLDRFKEINDSLGHDAGDQLLVQMAKRFTDSLRASDVVARLGGDEFVILLQEMDSANRASGVARKIIAAATQPVTLLEQPLAVTASIGISLYPIDAQDEQTLMKNADTAMYQAKKAGKNTYRFYADEMELAPS